MFGVVYGGIIFPPERAIFFPTAIVLVVVFGPVFAQSIFIGPSGFFYFSQTIFFTRGGVRIFNPGQPLQPVLCIYVLGPALMAVHRTLLRTACKARSLLAADC